LKKRFVLRRYNVMVKDVISIVENSKVTHPIAMAASNLKPLVVAFFAWAKEIRESGRLIKG